MIKLSKKIILFGLLFFLSRSLKAQQYQYSYTIDSIKETNFYKILITPELSAYCKTDFSDIRIADSSGQWIPSIIRKTYSISELKTISHTSYIDNPSSSIKQTDSSNGRSYIRISTDKNYQSDRILISISDPEYFSRKAELYLPINDSSTKISSDPIASFTIQTNTPNIFEIPRQKSKVFYLVINNEDNPPLKLKNVFTQQLLYELVAFLEKNKQYKLLLDNPIATAPNYDLEKFKDSILQNIPIIGISNFSSNSHPVMTPSKLADKNKSWIWVAIILAGCILLYFTFTLLKDIKKSGI